MPESGAAGMLLVEDSPADRDLTLRALKVLNLGSAVHVARDGEEALDYLLSRGAHELPRVVVLDLKLPGLDGIELLRRLREHPVTRSLPVVVLTSSREERDLAECYRLGVNSFVVKPVEFEPYTEAVRQLGRYWLQLNRGPR